MMGQNLRYAILRQEWLDTADEQVYRPPPYLGQHTDEILSELGYNPAQIEKLRSSGAI